MPIARFEMPDGRIGRFEVPDGTSPEQAQQLIAKAVATQPLKEKPPAEDPGVLSSIAIGAGKTVDSVLDGLTQMYLGARGEKAALGGLKENVQDKAEPYKRLQELHPFATGVGEALPSMVVPLGAGATAVGTAARMAAAGGVPAALEYGTPEERLKRGAVGAVAGAALPAAVAVGKTAKSLVEPLYEGGRNAIAARTLNRVAGDDAAVAATRMLSARPLVPGSMPTAAQVAENGGIAALERSAAASNATPFTERAMEQASARVNALRGVAGDDALMATAKADREAATKAIYSQADAAIAPVDGFFNGLKMRPQFGAAVKRAETIAKDEGYADIFFRNKDGNPVALLGVGAHYIKKALDEASERGANSYSGQAGAKAAAKTQDEFLQWLDKSIPEYAQASATYAAKSKPINQMQIGQELLTKLEPALADFGALGKDTAATYARAVRNAEQTAKAATGFPGSTLKNTLTPDQFGTVTAIAQDLARKSNAQDLGRGVGSNTFQNLAMQNIAEQSGMPGLTGGLLGLPGVSRATNWIYRDTDQKVQAILANALLDPAAAGTMMTGAQQTLLMNSPVTRRLLEEAAVRGGGLLGLSLVD
jgi:hypothetical protein